MVLYLSNEKWYDMKKKETIVDDCIKNCSPKNIEKFIDCKEKFTKTVDVNDMSLLKFIIDSDNSDACNFAKSKLSQPIVEIVTKCTLSNLQNLSLFESTISTLQSKNMISEEEKNELRSRMVVMISRSKSNKEIFNAINILSEKIEFPKEIVDKYCCGFVSSNNSNFKDNSTLNSLELIRKWSELKLEFNLLISLMKQLRKDKLLNQEIALEIALSSFNMKNDSLRTDAKLWSDILDEENELKLLEKTGDFGFGLTSSKPNVVVRAKLMMNDDGDLPQGAIEQIIERKEVHMFVDTPRFNQIVKSIKSPKQLKNVIFCLKENGRKKEIASIAIDYFGIPDALSQNIDDVVDLTYQLLK
ncbi:hypothetical protein TVAG_118180 [Trichomonas vaginalis G3]|uniref:Uncharacterized protein n=1 Tax=Trichomonas vaginalis (strain ATCC PRA-98 / G3) TaxID=412133 RepID=A2EI05_TRIV3|nr:hypothetical protein TVAGG3_0230320 [Trichomonas vaginalis G3]EAY07737.1 hypothetical protein TVAG_118180 [Trichomonas vaginalis G3]KAI5552580.1 hypothetical protein TVAGG3_0230320 [Trichomonas vaginalis G3]|eukprot:XP_001319960.1 hypothetical protein [Trichomonas vaginalis G3]